MIKYRYILIILILILNFIKTSHANNLNDVDKISKNLRCLICQGQSVYDSQSEFALSMKLLIKEKLKEGKNEKEITKYLEERYGEFILLKPKFNSKTYFLWLAPLFIILFGFFLIKKIFRKY